MLQRYAVISVSSVSFLVASTSDSAPAAPAFGGVNFQPYSRYAVDQVIADLNTVIGVGHDRRSLAGVADHDENGLESLVGAIMSEGIGISIHV